MRRNARLYPLLSTAALLVSAAAGAEPNPNFQLCTATGSGSSPNEIECVDRSGNVTQKVATSGDGGIATGGNAGALTRKGDKVLVINPASGNATRFHLDGGQLGKSELLATGGSTVSGALQHGAYVLTGAALFHFPDTSLTFDSSEPLLIGDGSAAQVIVTSDWAYVSEKSGSLEAFALAPDGSLAGPATQVSGVKPGVIVGMAAAGDVAIVPIAHLASNPSKSEIDVVKGLAVIQYEPTAQVAACWADADHEKVCIANPGSMSISCGTVEGNGFVGINQVAAADPGESQFDISLRGGIAGILVKTSEGGWALRSYSVGFDDQLFFINETPVGAPAANGALVLPPLR
jgi:hypothetical protein